MQAGTTYIIDIQLSFLTLDGSLVTLPKHLVEFVFQPVYLVLKDILLVLTLVGKPFDVVLVNLVLNPVFDAREVVGAFNALQSIHVEVVVPDIVHLLQVGFERLCTLFELS